MHRLVAATTTLLAAAAIAVVAQSGRLRHLNPPGLSTPTGYTHVVMPQRGRLVFIAGQVAADRTGVVAGKGDFKGQAKQVFENLKTARPEYLLEIEAIAVID